MNISPTKTALPNVIIFITHDQGIACSPYAGAGADAFANLPTPTLQRVADKGTILLNHFGAAPMCSPARGALFTGLYPHMNGLVGLVNRGFEYQGNPKTLIQIFRDAGYKTVLVGVQHESKDPFKLGYQEVYPLRKLKKALKKLTKDAKYGHPFYLCIGTGFMHRIWGFSPQRKVDKRAVHIPSYLPQDNLLVRTEVAQFVAKLKYYDEFLGDTLKLIEKFQLNANTYQIHTTDHGVAHGGSKGLLYEPGCHTLMMVNGPDIPPKKRLKALVSSVDFAPTLCDLCHIPIDPQFVGKSYKLLLTNPSETDAFRTDIFTENTYADKYNAIRSVRTAEFRYIRNYVEFPLIEGPPRDIRAGISFHVWKQYMARFGWNGPRPNEELYDIQKDPDCHENLLLKNPSHPKLTILRDRLDEFLEKTNDVIRNGPYPPQLGISVDNAKDFPHLQNRR